MSVSALVVAMELRLDELGTLTQVLAPSKPSAPPTLPTRQSGVAYSISVPSLPLQDQSRAIEPAPSSIFQYATSADGVFDEQGPGESGFLASATPASMPAASTG